MSVGVEAVTVMRRSIWKVLVWSVGLCLLAIAFRYLVIEWRPVSSLCEVAAPPFWCAIRQVVIEVFYSKAIGVASLAAGVLAFVLYSQRGSRFIAGIAVILAGPSIVLYSADIAAPAFLLGLLRLLRDERGA